MKPDIERFSKEPLEKLAKTVIHSHRENSNLSPLIPVSVKCKFIPPPRAIFEKNAEPCEKKAFQKQTPCKSIANFETP